MDLSKQVTIVIPCKNEKDIIQKTLDLLNYQSDIWGVKVVVCDVSDDGITKFDIIERLEINSDKFDLYLMDGGLPAVARNKGFKLVELPVFVKSEDEEGLASMTPPEGGARDDGDYKLGPGAILDLQPNENIEIADQKDQTKPSTLLCKRCFVKLVWLWNCRLKF